MRVSGQVMDQAVTYEDVAAAAERVRVLARSTPVETSRLFDERAGARTFFKCENLQRTGTFKIRGATNFLARLSAEQRARGIVAFSSGNHAQAVAIAAQHFHVRATIVMPTDAPKAKLASTQAYGPEIIFYDRMRDNREELARRVAEETGSILVPSYDHAWIIEGQGTAALEFLEQIGQVHAMAVPLGGGGLLSGTLAAAKALRPGIRVYGVEPELADDWRQSLARGERVEIAPPRTIADGLRTPMPGKLTFPMVQAMVDDVLLVSEEEIKTTVRFLLTRMKLLVEPSGAVAAAAVLHGKLPAYAGTAGVILSGGNVDLDVLTDICREAE